MASKSIDWDELLLTNDPKKKEIEVSFKKIDGEGYISFGDPPGTPPVTEGPDGQQPDTDDEGEFEEETDENDDPIIPDGDPIDPEEPPEDCEPGNDCEARWDLSDIAGPFYSWHRDSVLWLRDGYNDIEEGYFNYFNQSTQIDGKPEYEANHFTLLDQNGNEIYNGNDNSQPPSMGGGPSRMFWYTGYSNDPSIKFTTPSSPTNQGEDGKTDNRILYTRRKWAELDPECSGAYFCAPNFNAVVNQRRLTTTSSIWYESAEIYDPTNVPNPSKWVGEGAQRSGDEMEHEEWISVYLMRPYTGTTPLSDIYDPLTFTSWPTVTINHNPAFHSYVHNGNFGGNVFTRNVYAGTSSLEIDRFGRVFYIGSSGAGGANRFQGRADLGYYLGPGRELDGWYTVKHEKWISAARKETNESGDYGLYENGCTRLTQSFSTWFFNGRQITPRFMTSQFTRPTADTGPTFMAHDPDIPIHEYIAREDPQQRPSYGAVNKYERFGFPCEFVGHPLATFVSLPISASSRWDPNFIDLPGFSAGQNGAQYVEPLCNYSSLVSAGTQAYESPCLAYVDHSDIGKGFFGTQAYKNMRRLNPKVIPSYCERIPS